MPGLDADIDYATDGEGWQTPTAKSGYASPLRVRYQVTNDGVVDAMAERDLQHWVTSTDPETDLGIGGFGIMLLLASLVPATVRARRGRR